VKHSGWIAEKSSLQRQRGFVFKLLHSLLIVAIVVGLIVLYKTGNLAFLRDIPYYLGRVFEMPERQQRASQETPRWNDDLYVQAHHTRPSDTVERPQEDADYAENTRYAIQVAAGYDSRQLYELRDALIRDGYDAYLVSLSGSQGMSFKLRVGSYTQRMDAEAMRDRLRRRYPQKLGGSFIIQGE
jgi:hypothetical protein